MRQLVLGSLGRRVSWTLVTALLLPLLIMAAPPRQARAQLARVPAVAVLEFGVLTNSRTSAILGRNATDAIVVEMTRTGRFDPISRGQLNQQLQELGLTQPLNNNGIQKLGQALGVDYVASGDVTNIVMTDNPRRAAVTLSVRLTDVVSGELANGAIQTGYSQAPPPGAQPDDETLVNQAISDAAFSALKVINNYTLPEATILQTRDTSEVQLNRGGRDGLVPGQEMIVIRGRDRIGRIRVTSVASSDSRAAVLDYGKGIRPEDRARAVFQLPGYSVDGATGLITSTPPTTNRYTPRKNSSKPILTTLLMVGAAVFLATLLFSSKSRTVNSNGVSGVTARAYSEASVSTGTGTSSTSDPSARIEVTWQPAPDIPVTNILEYHIYRDETIIGVTTRNQTTFYDSATLGQFGGGLSAQTVTYGNTITNPFGAGNIVTTNTGTTNTGTNNNGNNGSTNSGSNSGSNTGTNSGTTVAQGTLVTISDIPVTPLSVGVPHRYRVEVVYQQLLANNPGNSNGGTGGTNTGNSGGNGAGGTNTSGGNNGGTNTGNASNGQLIYKVSNLQAQSGQATPIARPQTTGPTSDQNLAQVRVTFRTVQGADQYVVEFATDPSFSKKVVRGPFYSSYTSGATTQTDILDLSSSFSSVAAGARIYYRVGGRNSTDNPGPLERGTPNGGNYIYSTENLTFAKLGNPPSAPQLTP